MNKIIKLFKNFHFKDSKISSKHKNKKFVKNNKTFQWINEKQNNYTQYYSSTLSSEVILAIIERKAKIKAFYSLCERNSDFLQQSKVIDGYLLSICFIYFQRIYLDIDKYNDENLFSAMVLAIGIYIIYKI